jgi:SAM-dependent methyltransferase
MPVQAWHGEERPNSESGLRTLSYDEARTFYNRFGRGQDWQRFYEDPAVDDLTRHLQLDAARRVFEFGCGTGRLAERLLREHLPEDARYVAVDISATMVRLTQGRLAPFGERAQVHRTDGPPQVPAVTASFDRFISTYVCDLLSEQDIEALIAEAHRVLVPNGLLGLVGLTHGRTFGARLVERGLTALHRLRPTLVGGCRPMSLETFIGPDGWRVDHRATVTRWGISSEVMVASKLNAVSGE